MEITADACHQPELPRQDRQATHLLQRLHTVDHFQRMTARLGEFAYQSTSFAAGEIVLPRMRQTDPCAGVAQGAYGSLKRWPMLFDVSQLAGAEPLAECLGAVAHMPGTHEIIRKMRACRRVAAIPQLLLNGPGTVQRTGHPLGLEALSNRLGALPAARVQLADSLLQRNSITAKRITQHMDGGAIPDTGQLDAIDQPDTQRISSGAGIIEPFEGIVIGQRKQFDATRMSSLHQHVGRKHAVGGGAMAMQINNHSKQILQGAWPLTACDRQRQRSCRRPVCQSLRNVLETASRQRSAKSAVCYYAGHICPLACLVKQIIDFVPLLLFFIAYKIAPTTIDIAGFSLDVGGIFSATAVLVVSSVILYGVLFIHQRRLEKSQWLTLAACLLFGGLTLALHSEAILKWKAPVLNWLFALAFTGSHFIGDKPLIQRMMGHAVRLPAAQWTQLNVAWILFFLVCGFANLFVAFIYPAIWVDFKVFGSLGLTLLFMAGQALYLVRHMQPEPEES